MTKALTGAERELRRKAYNEVAYARLHGTAPLPPEVCERCQKPARGLQGHHEDYTKPLELVFLCDTCHFKRHAEIREERDGIVPLSKRLEIAFTKYEAEELGR